MTLDAPRAYVFRNKYRSLGDLLKNAEGTLLDVGARDRVLSRFLDPARVRYFSADMGPGHDYRIDLEKKVDLPDGKFDCVVALDVLEHVENIHGAFHELARLAGRRLIIALPNMATGLRRLSFLLRGHLMSGKYDLLPEHQGDRHRWLTVYPEINAFVEKNAPRAGFRVERIVEEMDGGRAVRALSYAAVRAGILPGGLAAERCIYVMERIKP